MSEKGTSATIKVIMFVLAVLGSGITMYTVFHVPLANGLAQEKEYRQTEDAKLREKDIEMRDALTQAIQNQQTTNESIKIVLAEIQVDLKYIKREVNNGTSRDNR